MAWVTVPEAPNSRMMARPMTKGGVMIGNTLSRRSSRLARKPVRVAKRAKASPRTVVLTPTTMAIKREFQATPQLTLAVRQPTPQMSRLNSFSTKR